MQNHTGQFVLVVDQGTTSTRVVIFDQEGELVSFHQETLSQIRPHPGWHEQDPEELFASVLSCMESCIATFQEKGLQKKHIICLAVTNQRETTIVWDANTGRPLHNAIVWGDTRTKDIVKALKQNPRCDSLISKTGLPISTYSAAVKLCWLLDNDAATKLAYDAGTLIFGTLDSWLIYKLNGDVEHDLVVTDTTNASRTGFMDLDTRAYDTELLDFYSTKDYEITKVRMPDIYPSSHVSAFGTVRHGIMAGIPITGCVGDQSAALIGHRGFAKGSAKSTYGTGCFCLFNTGNSPIVSDHGLLTTIGYDFGSEMVYALEGSIATAGSGVNFLIENWGFAENAAALGEIANTVKDTNGVVFVTAFSGLFAPYWIEDAQGTIFGITMNTKRAHIARAVFDAVCFQTRAVLDAMHLDSSICMTQLNVDGGMSQSDICMQLQADVLGIRITRPRMCEITALGAAFTAGLASKVWNSVQDLEKLDFSTRVQIFEPRTNSDLGQKGYEQWERAVDMCRGWLAL